jgi:hypothetical protein
MNDEKNRLSDDEIDQMVTAEQIRRAARADLERLQARISSRLADSSQPRIVARWRLIVPASVAAALMLAVGLFTVNNSRALQAAELVRHAIDQARVVGDRQYRFSGCMLPGVFEKMPSLLGSPPWQVSTRGDRFVVKSSVPNLLAWGCDEQGRSWFVQDRYRGVRFEPGELGASAERVIKVLSLQMDVILDDLLRNWRLKVDSSLSDRQSICLIATRSRSRDRGLFDHIELVIDRSSHVVEKLILQRSDDPESGQFFFELEGTLPVDDDHYRAEGYLEPDAKLLEADRPILRQRVWRSLVGPSREPTTDDSPTE